MAVLLSLLATLASAASASATVVTTTTGGAAATPTFHAVNSGGHITLANPIVNISCSSTAEGKIESHGESTTATGKLSNLTFTGCTNSWHVTVVTAGSIEIHWTTGHDGVLTSSGAKVDNTRLGITCVYGTSNTKIGTIKGGNPAVLQIEASIPILTEESSSLCGSGNAKWEGQYAFTTPLYVASKAASEPTTTLTAPTGTAATPAIKAESEGHVALDHPIAKIQCGWTFEGTVKSDGAGGAKIPLSSLSTSGCTESWHATTVAAGELDIDWTSGYNGVVTWTGGTVEMTRLGTICRYKTENTKLGTITGGSPATIHIEANLPFDNGNALCGTEAYPLTGSLKLASPGSLYVDK
ncbi:MAG TPA: hypothetical protein VFR75_09960 [Solirubrobacterales bacterium]|nr:hypothetical protein [Solirubrobacterales bacterium]